MADTKYIETIGRRKTSAARVRITPSSKRTVTVNDKPLEDYFPTTELQSMVVSPFGDLDQQFTVTAVVKGGGVSSQADSVRHGIARALTEYDKELRGVLKKKGYLKRDPRKKERKKPGLKKARKSPQWSKR